MGPLTTGKPRPRALVRTLAVCSAALALFAVVLWPSRSLAAIVPACEADFVSRVAAPALDDAAPATSTTDGSCGDAADDDIDNSRAAPMCDARGASAVAPPRIRNVSDVRLERHRPCDTGETVTAAVSPGRGDPPLHTPDVMIDRAMMPSMDMPSPSHEVALVDPLAQTDGPRAGVRGNIYHPPR